MNYRYCRLENGNEVFHLILIANASSVPTFNGHRVQGRLIELYNINENEPLITLIADGESYTNVSNDYPDFDLNLINNNLEWEDGHAL